MHTCVWLGLGLFLHPAWRALVHVQGVSKHSHLSVQNRWEKKEGEGACQHDIGHLWRKRVSCCMCSPVTGRCSFQGAVGNAAGVDSEPANECKLHYLWSSPGTQKYQGYYFFLVFSLLRKSVNLLLAWPVLINNSYIPVLAQEWKLVRNSQPIICFTLPCICPR